jgi:hypothetical protein
MLSSCALCELLVAKSDIAGTGSAKKGAANADMACILKTDSSDRYRLDVVAMWISRIASARTLWDIISKSIEPVVLFIL